MPVKLHSTKSSSLAIGVSTSEWCGSGSAFWLCRCCRLADVGAGAGAGRGSVLTSQWCGSGSAFRSAGAAAVLVLVQALALDRRAVLVQG